MDGQADLFDEVARFCEESLPGSSVYGLLARERDRLFPDELFSDLFTDRGRRSVPPSVVATVMVLQRLEGLSDREAVERYAFDVRWRYASGVGGYGAGGPGRFAHTVLVDMRQRLHSSQHPDRIFEVGLSAAREAGLVGRKRVLDSTPLYDAVATMDTVTLIRSALRGLLAAAEVADADLAAALRGALSGGDDYATAGKPQIDWDDPAAREALIDARARDGYGCLAVLHGRELDEAVQQAGELLATVLGQDLEHTDDGIFRIAHGVARDRVISTVDPDARHGHKTSARGFDGYKGHAAADPDSEIITATTVTPGNTGDAAAATDLISDLLPDEQPRHEQQDEAQQDGEHDPADEQHDDEPDSADEAAEQQPVDDQPDSEPDTSETATVYGDAAYGSGPFQDTLDRAGIESRCKTQPPVSPGGRFGKDRFDIDLDTGTVGCPAGASAPIRPTHDGGGIAAFGTACSGCPLRAQCTTSTAGRTITISPYEQALSDARARQADPAWQADYRATRPKIERKLGHLTRRRHGGRKARVRGTARVDADFRLLAGAANFNRLATLGLVHTPAGWATAL